MKVKHPAARVKIELESWEVEALIVAAQEVAEAYRIESAARKAAWKPGTRHVPPVISSTTFLLLADFAQALKE